MFRVFDAMGQVPTLPRRPPCPCVSIKQGNNQPLTFWYRPFSIFGLFNLTRFIISSLVLTLSIKPCPRSALMLADQMSPRGFIMAFAGVRRLGSFTPRCYRRRMCQ
jgi:hypothetical protein